MIDGVVEPHERAAWAEQYRLLYKWALAMGNDARERGDECAAQRWYSEANIYADKHIEHILAQDNQ